MIINLSRIDFGGVATGGKAKPEEVFDVQPTTTDQTITPTEGSVFSGGTVRAVTSEIDVNIASNNIKEGVTILGVAGTLKEEKPEERFNVQPTTAEQTITPTEGSVFSGGTVHAVTAAIDVNITSNNIKEGVTILGVAGTHKGEKPEESFNVQPTTSEQTITPTEGSVFSRGTVKAVTSSIDSNIQPENIKEGVSILGVAGTLSGGSGGDTPDYRYAKGTVDKAGLKAIGWTDEDILTYEQNNPHYAWQNDQYKVSDENKALYLLDDPNPSSYKNNPNITFVPKKNMESYFAKAVSFNGMKYIKGIPFYDTSNMTSLHSMFEDCSNLKTVPPIDTSNIINGYGTFSYCSSLRTVPQLNLLSATNINSLFAYCNSLTTVPPIVAPEATDISGMFQNCYSLTAAPPIVTPKATDAHSMFSGCNNLVTISQLDISSVIDASYLFSSCTRLITIPSLNTSMATNVSGIFQGCAHLTTVEGIDFSGLTSNNPKIFGYASNMSKLTRFIVNGKLNVSMSSNNDIKALTAIDYDSVKSILAAADRTDNTNAKELAFNRTMTDQNGELAALVASCTSKGWTITGLTLQ